ncbi:MAG TPA: hypothetical protein VGA00_03930, partial [Acidiferrobacterales bacterium]
MMFVVAAVPFEGIDARPREMATPGDGSTGAFGRRTAKEFAMKIYMLPLIVAALSLSACGTTGSDRALSGGGIGAGTGAALGA